MWGGRMHLFYSTSAVQLTEGIGPRRKEFDISHAM